MNVRRGVLFVPVVALITLVGAAPAQQQMDPASSVNPLIGSTNGGNTFPGAVLPFGMLAWSPENVRIAPDPARANAPQTAPADVQIRPAAPGGYQFDATRIRGFSLTHLSGTGCRGASGDIPFMPIVGEVVSSPSADIKNAVYASDIAHADEVAEAGAYKVRLQSGVSVELTATTRSGAARFTFPQGQPATMLIRTSDSEVGSSDAKVTIDRDKQTVSGSVTSGNFCGYLSAAGRRSYYTLHFVAVFDQPFTTTGTWQDDTVKLNTLTSSGGTTYGTNGFPAPGKGSGAFVGFAPGSTVTTRVGISYVSEENAHGNLSAEQPAKTSLEDVKKQARAAWNRTLGRAQVTGGTETERRIFYTALYHSLLHMNVFSDANGEYYGFDGKVHKVAAPQRAQYANFSGWDVYRSQLQLVALLEPQIASDMAQSLLNQADQNNGVWDRWTHNSGATAVMEGDASPPAVASIAAFGGTSFDMKSALASLKRAATTPTALDLSNEGCNVMCRGQRPSLDKWLSIHYIPTVSNAWGGAGETLEDATADFALAQLAQRTGDMATHREFMLRSDYWRNVYNPERGYIQNRNEDGTWPDLNPSQSRGFAEGSAVQYTWMVPFNVQGLFDAMGGAGKAKARLDAFFKNDDGTWALTRAGGTHAELSNEPSIATPWLYLYTGEPHKSQEILRWVLTNLWKDAPNGIPGNDDLGAMSSWYVWTAMGLYPGIPGRAELFVTAPLFPKVVVTRGNGRTITVEAPGASAATPYVASLRSNGRPTSHAWLPESFVASGGRLVFTVSATADRTWGSSPADAPPSFPAASPSTPRAK